MDEKIFTRNRLRLPKVNLKQKETKRVNIKQRPPILRKCGNRQRFVQVLVIIFIAFTFAYFVLQSIKPIMEQQCKNTAKAVATKICNNEATEVMKKYSYEDLLNITKDEQGNIKMIGTNVITVNEIISDIPVHIQEALEKDENNSFNIKLGSFLGSKLLAGRGPNVNIKLELVRKFRH